MLLFYYKNHYIYINMLIFISFFIDLPLHLSETQTIYDSTYKNKESKI